MREHTNILILSCGTRVKIVEYFKRTLTNRGKVYATDCSPYAPALYVADDYDITPRIDADGYIEEILDICEKRDITGVFSLIDPELSLISKNLDKFTSKGIVPIISSNDVIEICFDKYRFAMELEKHDINHVVTYIDIESFETALEKEEVSFPVFVKPRWGSASIDNNVVYSLEQLVLLFKAHDNLIIQKFITGEEFGVDVYVDMNSKELSVVFMKKKIKMRAGETDKAISVKEPALLSIIQKLVQVIPVIGIVDVDVFQVDGVFYVSEINPRFGGGYPHAYECGVDIPSMILKNLQGEANTSRLMEYSEDIAMMKYSDVVIQKGIQLG